MALRMEALGCLHRQAVITQAQEQIVQDSSCFMAVHCPAKGFLGDVYHVGSSVRAAQHYRLSAISCGTAGSEAAVPGAMRAWQGNSPRPCSAMAEQPKESSSGMSPSAATSVPKHSACR